MWCYNSTLSSFMMSCFRFLERHACIILRRIRETRQYDFLCTAPLQFPSEYFRNFKMFRCHRQEYVFLRNYKDLKLSLCDCTFSLFSWFVHLPVCTGLLLFHEPVWLGQPRLPTAYFQFNLFFMFMFTPQPRSPLRADWDRKLYECQD